MAMQRNYGLNGQIKELGLDPSLVTDEAAVDSYISRLDEHFDLVLVQERFRESVVLLAELLCLPLQNVTSVSQKVRTDDERVTTK